MSPSSARWPTGETRIIDSHTPAKYNLEVVESVILEVAAELHPLHLTTEALLLEIVSDPTDPREVKTAEQAISGLREVELLEARDDEVVKPTHAALRAVSLLAG